MALLDELLAGSPAMAAATPAAAGAVPAAPAAPASDGDTPLTMPNLPAPNPQGALQQAIQIVNSARTAQQADPNTTIATQAIADDKAARAEAAAKVEANNQQIAALNAEPGAPRPSVPRLKELPAAPTPTPKDPMRVFGQMLPVIAAFGALTTQRPAINALNAATAMLNAAKANDHEEEAKQRQTWIDNLNQTVQNNNQLLGQYKLDLDDHTLSVSEKMARIQALAAQNQDNVTLAALKGGNLEGLTKFISIQQNATGQIAELTKGLLSQQQDEHHQHMQELARWAELEIERRKAGSVSMGDAIGTILQKVAQNGGAPGSAPKDLSQILDPGELQALATYQRINANGGFTNNPATAPAAAQGGGIAGLTGQAPAPAVTAPAAAPSVTAIPESVYAERTAQARRALGKAGVTRDQVKAVWMQSGLPATEFDKRVK